MNKQVTIWFSAIVIMLVTCGAIAFAFTDVMSDRLNGTKRSIFVVTLGLYSVYRGFRLRQALKK
ncbi:MAG: hypothetical protein AB7O73_13715 [Bacteroidia bacterium]